MIASINQKSFKNTLFVILNGDQPGQQSETKNNITRIFVDDETLGFNFRGADQIIDLNNRQDGQIFLTKEEVDHLNDALKSAGFDPILEYTDKPTLVYAYVKTSVVHPDSDHLHITMVDVGDGNEYQIVCGAKNIAAGETVVAALPGTLMPDGSQIWPGALRGVESYGMICSARELAVKNAPDKPGILELPETFEVGDAFNRQQVEKLFN